MATELLDPWRIAPNATFEAVLICKDDAGAELSVVGCKARMDFKTNANTGSTSLFSLTDTDGLTLAGESVVEDGVTYHDGVIRITVTPDKAKLLEELKGFADLLVQLSSTNVMRVYDPPRHWIGVRAVTPATFS